MFTQVASAIFEKPLQRTPNSAGGEIQALCASISATSRPLYVETIAEPGAQALECFINVATKVRSDGGTIANGWVIWEWPGVFVEAEHHAVWNSGQGLVDITPRTPPMPLTDRVLFLPDPTATFDEATFRRRINVKRALTDQPLVALWIAARTRQSEFIEDISIGREIRLTNRTIERLEAMEMECRQLHVDILIWLANTTKRNDRCPCGSGRKFKACCLKLFA